MAEANRNPQHGASFTVELYGHVAAKVGRAAAQVNGNIKGRSVRDAHQLSLCLCDLVVDATQYILTRDGEVVLHPERRQAGFNHAAVVVGFNECAAVVPINGGREQEDARQSCLRDLHRCVGPFRETSASELPELGIAGVVAAEKCGSRRSPSRYWP